MTHPVLTTERLSLRPLRESDAEALHAVFADEDVMRWWSSGPHKDLAETRDYVSQNSADISPTWAITVRPDDIAIGWIVLLERRPGVREIGYILGQQHWRKGIGHEAVNRIIGHGFNDLKLRRIYADVDPDHIGSMALLKNFGFQQEAHLREEWETHIGVRDSLIFGLLRSEWPDSSGSL